MFLYKVAAGQTGPSDTMDIEQKCSECGAALSVRDAHPVCPACIFRRLAASGSTIVSEEYPVRSSVWTSGLDDDPDTDFLTEYELLGEIGRGGMGVIYKAHQPGLNRTVAIKVVHAAGLEKESARRRFQSEVKVAGRLNHPHIVPVFDVGLMEGSPCFSMEYFAGGSMADWLKGGHRTSVEGVRLLVKVTRAVSFAHQRGILHRDLKPGNILLDSDGEPHVADFGLAKELNSGSDITHPGAILGSPNYMSPEQAAGRADALTVSTDIYSLGALLYELLTGRPPFVAATPLETMRLVVEQEPTPPSTLAGRADRDLQIICLKCLEKEPARRYVTAADLADDLERWLRHEPILARPASQPERFRKWVRRHPALAAVSTLLLVVLLTGMAGVTWQWRQTEAARSDESLQRRRAETALAHSSIALAEAALREGNGPAVQTALSSVPPELRDGNWTYLAAESDTSRPLPPLGLGLLDSLAADPTRRSTFAAADHSGRVVIFDVRNGSRQREFPIGFLAPSTNAAFRIAFARKGDRVAVGRERGGGIVIHDALDGRKIIEWAAPPSRTLEFSADGSLLIQVSADRASLIVWNVASGSPRWKQVNAYHSARFTDDSSLIASFNWDEGLRLVNADDGQVVRRLPGTYMDMLAPQPGSSLLVAGNPLGLIRGFDLDDGRPRFELQPHQTPISQVEFLPGGEQFLTATTLPDGRQSLQCRDSNSGRTIQTLHGGSGEIRNLCLHPLSGELIVQGNELRVWDTVSVAPLRVLRGNNPHPSAVLWGTEDHLFAPAPPAHGSSLQSIATPQPQILWSPKTEDHGQPSLSADGRRAAVGRYNSNRRIAVLEWSSNQVRQVAAIAPGRLIAYARLSSDGNRLAIVQKDYSRIRIHEVPTGAEAVNLEQDHIRRISDVAWLSGGRHLVGLVTSWAPRSTPGSVEEIVLWDAATGQRLRSMTNASLTSVICASPDGARFIEAGADRQVRVRDATTLKVLHEFRAHNGPITALAWHPTQPIVATAAEDLIIRLWHLGTGRRLEELRGPLLPPSVLSFSPAGRRLATAARDGAARIWEPASLASPARSP